MLLEFGFKNFFSFREGAIISFKLDANCPTHISQSKSYTTVLGIKGANASGKTNILRAISFLSTFASKSFNLDPESLIGIDTFSNSKQPAEMYAEFCVGKVLYRYELSLTDREIHSEVIYRTKLKKSIKLIERQKNKVTFRTNECKKIDGIKLRKNVSIISLSHQHEFDPLEDVHNFFNRFPSNVNYRGLSENVFTISRASKFLNERPDVLEFVKTFIKGIDAGISDIEIQSFEDKDGEKEYFPFFSHKAGNKHFYTTDETESSGTKTLFKQLPIYFAILKNGGVLIQDEIDINIHPHILPLILDLFLDPKTNPKGAQIIFSSHNTEIINYLGRYRAYLVNKKDNESYTYRLDQIPGDILRNDRQISPAYSEGKIGGVPNLNG